jgi:hypothetical protein
MMIHGLRTPKATGWNVGMSPKPPQETLAGWRTTPSLPLLGKAWPSAWLRPLLDCGDLPGLILDTHGTPVDPHGRREPNSKTAGHGSECP